jgi:hypothetical protein
MNNLIQIDDFTSLSRFYWSCTFEIIITTRTFNVRENIESKPVASRAVTAKANSTQKPSIKM